VIFETASDPASSGGRLEGKKKDVGHWFSPPGCVIALLYGNSSLTHLLIHPVKIS
jgi:hypothetical protein